MIFDCESARVGAAGTAFDRIEKSRVHIVNEPEFFGTASFILERVGRSIVVSWNIRTCMLTSPCNSSSV